MKEVTNVYAGGLLLAQPIIADPLFKRSVILVAEHDERGDAGFILNKLTDVRLNEAVEDFPVFDTELYFGGPVDTDTLFYIHTLGDFLPDSKEIMKGIYWGGDYDRLKFLIETRQVHKNQIRFYAGYSGWEPYGLEEEYHSNLWILGNGSPEQIFTETPDILWSEVLRGMKNKYSLLANFPQGTHTPDEN